MKEPITTKPITVAQTELANKLVNAINESNLHPSILMPVIEEIYTITQNLLKETQIKEMEQYQKNVSTQQRVENEAPRKTYESR